MRSLPSMPRIDRLSLEFVAHVTKAPKAMSWQHPVPPIMNLWSGLAILAATIVLASLLIYLLMRL